MGGTLRPQLCRHRWTTESGQVTGMCSLSGRKVTPDRLRRHVMYHWQPIPPTKRMRCCPRHARLPEWTSQL
jgi:hypothetical protein